MNSVTATDSFDTCATSIRSSRHDRNDGGAAEGNCRIAENAAAREEGQRDDQRHDRHAEAAQQEHLSRDVGGARGQEQRRHDPAVEGSLQSFVRLEIRGVLERPRRLDRTECGFAAGAFGGRKPPKCVVRNGGSA